MFYARSFLPFIVIACVLQACSTAAINLTDTNSMLNTTRSLEIRQNEAERVLIMDLASMPLRPEDIARFEAILINPNSVVFIPEEPLSDEERSALIPLGSARTPSPEQLEQDNPAPAVLTPTDSPDEARVRALERQAAIRLLSQNPSSFPLILAQLSDSFENVRLEALKVVLAADASHEQEIWRILQSGLLDSHTRALVIPFFLKTGTRGVARLMILIADQDEEVRTTAAAMLVQIFPSPNNNTLTALIRSSNPASRAIAPLWLITYRNEPALRIVLSLVDDPHPTVRAAASSAYSITQVQEWAAIPSLAYLRMDLPSASRSLVISRLISIAHPLVIPYVYELLDHPDLNLSRQSFSFASALGHRYHAELTRLIRSPDSSPLLLTQLIELIERSNTNRLRQELVPLLNHPDSEVRVATQAIISTHFNDFAVSLNQLFNPQERLLSNLFIAQLFIKKVNPAILYELDTQTFSYHRLTFIWRNIALNSWNNFLAALPRSRNRIEITLLYTFYQSVQRLTWVNINHPDPLITLSTAMTQNALAIQQASRQNPALLTALLNEQQTLQRRWQTARSQANATSRDLFTQHAQALRQLNDAQLSLPLHHEDLVNRFLAPLNLSSAFLKEFTILNLTL